MTKITFRAIIVITMNIEEDKLERLKQQKKLWYEKNKEKVLAKRNALLSKRIHKKNIYEEIMLLQEFSKSERQLKIKQIYETNKDAVKRSEHARNCIDRINKLLQKQYDDPNYDENDDGNDDL